MDATLIVIDSDAELARARSFVDRLMASDDPSDLGHLQAQARLIAAYEANQVAASAAQHCRFDPLHAVRTPRI